MLKKACFVLLLALSACAVAPREAMNKESLIGSWEFLGMTKDVVPVERLDKSGMMKGQMNFKADGTFDGDFIYPRTPEKNTKAFGTYTLDNGIITIVNQSNNSNIKSELKMEKDVLIVKPLVENGFVMYLRRLP
jgi:hypothetical protein